MADVKEFFNEQQLQDVFLRFGELLKTQMWVSMPCKVISFDAQRQSVTVQPLIQSKVRKVQNGKTVWVDRDMPQFREIPVQFPSGGGWSITMPLQPGDEGSMEVQSRCIDNWWNPPGNMKASSTGQYPQAEVRLHDLNDCYFKPGGRSKARWLKNVSTTALQIRSDDGRSYIELSSGNNGGASKLVFPDGLTIEAPWVQVTAAGNGTGEVRAAGEITAKYGSGASVTQTQHRHTQGVDSHGDAEVPTNPAIRGT